MTGCAATAQKSALVDPAIQPDALRMAAVDLARQQADEIERLRAERDALQEDLRCVAHSGMGSGLEQKPAAWACIWPDECGGGGFTTLDETAARNYMAGAREYQPGPKLVPLYAAPVHVAPAGWQLVPVEPTVEMLIAGDDSVAHINDSVSTSAIYRAMLASAPKGGE